MSLQSSTIERAQWASAEDAPLFGSTISESILEEKDFDVESVASLYHDAPKVSAIRLEQYLNASNPICSG